MNPLIMISGGTGTRKREVGKLLEERLGTYYQRFSPGETKRKLGKPDCSHKDTILLMYDEIFQVLKDERGAIVHSHYKTQKGRQIVYDTAALYSVPVLLIECVNSNDTRSRTVEDIKLDFENGKNGHVSWIIYDSHKSNIGEMLIRSGLRNFSSQIIELLQYAKPQ